MIEHILRFHLLKNDLDGSVVNFGAVSRTYYIAAVGFTLRTLSSAILNPPYYARGNLRFFWYNLLDLSILVS